MMADAGRSGLERLTACVAERDAAARASMVESLKAAGVSVLASFASLEPVAAAPPASLIIIGDDAGADALGFIRRLRHKHFAHSPFAIVAVLAAADADVFAASAVAAGVDDVLPRPINHAQLLQRLRRVLLHRAGFVVTPTYIGPDRRAGERGRGVRPIMIPAALLGGSAPGSNSAEAIALERIVQARLDSAGLVLGVRAKLLVDAVPGDGDAGHGFDVMRAVLADAATIAGAAREPVAALVCEALLAEAPQHCVDAALKAWAQKVDAVAPAALRPRLTPAQRLAERDLAVEAFTARPRTPSLLPLNWGSAQARRFPAGDGLPLELRNIPAGAMVFRPGEPSGHIILVVDGSLGLYRERQGRSLPLMKLRRGEIYGDASAWDGPERRVSAVALEDSVVAGIPRSVMRARLEASDPALAAFLGMLAGSLRAVQEVYESRPRHISDSIRQMQEQLAAIHDYVTAASAPAGLKTEAAGIEQRLAQLTDDLIALIAGYPSLDPRSPALPLPADRGIAETEPERRLAQ